MNNLEIIVPDVYVNENLSWTDICADTVKATKAHCDPLSDCCGVALGCLGCIAIGIAIQSSNKKHTATRHDVLHADQIRRTQREGENCGYKLGYCLGDGLVDSGAIVVGGAVGFVRATVLTLKGNNSKKDSVLGLSREEIDRVNLFDSCCG